MKLKLLNWYITKIIIPLILVLCWFALFMRYVIVNNVGLGVLTERYNSMILHGNTSENLLASQKIEGEFIAKDNHLGIVAIRFKNFSRINDDHIIFRLKEANHHDWYYENSYKVDQFQQDQFFPFGFPIIDDSLNKIYKFELESASGTEENSVALSDKKPIILVKYQYSKSDIRKSIREFSLFAIKKSINLFQDTDLLFTFILFSYPLLFYVLWQTIIISFSKHFFTLKIDIYRGIEINANLKNLSSQIIKKKLISKIKFGYPLILFIILGFIIDIFFLDHNDNYVRCILIVLWCVAVKLYRIESKIHFGLGIILIMCAIYSVNFATYVSTLKNLSWLYIILFIGFTHTLVEYKYFNKDLVSFISFLRNIVQLKK